MKGRLPLGLSLAGACLLAMAAAGSAHAFVGKGAGYKWRGGYWHQHARHYHHAPELDPSLLGKGLALLGGSILILSERRRKR